MADPGQRATARAFLHATIKPDLSKIRGAVADARADAYTAAAVGTAVTDRLKPLPFVDAVIGHDTVTGYWDTWKPGDTRASALLNDGGFQRLLADADVTIKGISDTTLDRLGTILADGAGAGLSVDEIAAQMADVLDDPNRAYLIADTELARAQTEATMDTFDQNGVAQWDWLVSDGACDDCQAMADGGPYDMADDGDQPPAHPGCRCAATPVAMSSDDSGGAGSDVSDE